MPDDPARMTVNPAEPGTVPKFVDALPIPPVAQPLQRRWKTQVYTLPMLQVRQQLHRDFAPTAVWGYGGAYPGPTIEARRNQPVVVHWRNELPTQHLFTVDHTIHGAAEFYPDVRTVVHLHEGNTPPQFDGHPDAWYTPGLTEVGSQFVTDRYEYPNRQRPATLWYHDHAIGITRLNIYAGLAGLYILRDEHEERLHLPCGPYEIPLIIQDRTFNEDASLFYPAAWEPEFFGNTVVVNGKVWPRLDVEPRLYRLRILNAANARFFNLQFDPALPLYQIGTDGGLLYEPVTVTEVLLGPAERADVVVDFSGQQGRTFTLTNDAAAPFPDGDAPDEHTGVVMQFSVTLPITAQKSARLPERLAARPPAPPRRVARTRDLILEERMEHGRLIVLLGNRNLTGRPQPYAWGDSTTENPILGTVEVWRLINLTEDTHPIHLHLVTFLILDRQPFDVQHLTATGELRFTGSAAPPPLNERGWKDTVLAHPGEVTRIIVPFGDFAGPYVWHCHILEHEDNEMMRRMEVVRPNCLVVDPAVNRAWPDCSA